MIIIDIVIRSSDHIVIHVLLLATAIFMTPFSQVENQHQ